MKPWREIAVPHRDVLEGTFQQSEFAADITAVHSGKATKEYQDAAAFFDRTFITEGMRLLLTQVAQRLVGKGGEALKKMMGSAAFFDGVHIFTPNADVPDDSALRLVVLSPDHWYSRDDERQATTAVLDYVRNNGTKPRYRGNRLVFLAPEMAILSRLRDVARTALAWNSIVDDVKEGRLNIDLLQKKQAEKELQSAEEVVPRAAREGYKWLLCPVQHTPTDPKPIVEAFPLTTSGGTTGSELERVCIDNELVITTWSAIHLRTKLHELYWKDGKTTASAMAFWEDSDPNASLNITVEINAEFPSGASDQIKRSVTENATSLGFCSISPAYSSARARCSAMRLNCFA